MSPPLGGIGELQARILETLATLGRGRQGGWVPGESLHTRGFKVCALMHALAAGRVEVSPSPFNRSRWKESRYRLTPTGGERLEIANAKRPQIAGADTHA